MKITEFIEEKAKRFFEEQKKDVHSSSPCLANLYRWEIDFRAFAEDIFKKWLASRSAVSVNQLLDEGLTAEDEQMIVKKLESELTAYFDTCQKSFFFSLRAPIRRFWFCILLWTALAIILFFVYFPDNIERLTIINFWIAGVSFGGARTLSSLQKKNLIKRSECFLENFFTDAEKKWLEDQNNIRYNKEF